MMDCSQMIDLIIDALLKSECEHCFCRLMYRGQEHRCPVIGNDDAGFMDSPTLDEIIERREAEDLTFFLQLLIRECSK